MPDSSSRIAAFDSLRGLAACTVIISHFFMVMRGQADVAYANFYGWTEVAAQTPFHVLWQGHAAVVLFFTLSGFVLYLLLDKARLSMPAYVAKRVVRLYVPYLAAIIPGLIGAWLVTGDTLHNFNDWIGKFWSWPVTVHAVLEHLLFLGQFNSDRFDFTIWTLVHEMRISLVFPLIFLMVKRMRWWTALAPFVVGSVTVTALCQPVVKDHFDIIGAVTHGGLTAYIYTIHYMLAFAIGACLANYRKQIFAFYAGLSGRTRVLVAASTFLLYVYGSQVMHITGLVTMMPYDWPLMVAAALMLVVAAAEPTVRSCLEIRPFLYLGRISYSLYLFHPVVLLAMLHLFAGWMPLGWLLVLTFALCFLVSDMAWRLVEWPAVQLSRKAADGVGQLYDHMRSRFVTQ